MKIFNFINEVLKSSKAAKIKDDDVALKEYYNKEWKTYQMSDHNLLWARVSNDKSEKYLRSLTDK